MKFDYHTAMHLLSRVKVSDEKLSKFVSDAKTLNDEFMSLSMVINDLRRTIHQRDLEIVMLKDSLMKCEDD